MRTHMKTTTKTQTKARETRTYKIDYATARLEIDAAVKADPKCRQIVAEIRDLLRSR